MFTAVSDRGSRDLRDHRVLGGEAVGDVEDIAADRQVRRDPFDQPADGNRCLLGIAAVPLPQPEVQPPGREREEEVGTDRVVDGGGGIPRRTGASRSRAGGSRA